MPLLLRRLLESAHVPRNVWYDLSMALKLYEHRRRIDDNILLDAAHKVFQFPGGESSVDFTTITATRQVAHLTGADGNDLMTLAMWADGVHRHKAHSTLLLPYLPGARADRGVPLGAKVYADFINSLGIDEVITVDPHSDVAPALYNNLHVIHLEELPFWEDKKGKWDGIIIPDLGAVKRASAVAAKLDLPTFQAKKLRDFKTGKLSGFECENLPWSPIGNPGHYLVVDDICDGGGTFLGLADALPPHERLSLWVTHGIFSNQAAAKLYTKYVAIHTTDSHPGSNLLSHESKLLQFMINQSGKVY